MKYIDIETWKRKKQYEQFSAFAAPCYTVGTCLDVTQLVRRSKELGISFFDAFVYVLTHVCNQFEGFRLRMDAEKRVLCYDRVHPSYTVLLPDTGYEVCRTEFDGDLFTFSKRVREDIEKVKNGGNGDTKLNGDGKTDLLYLSCVPWVDVQLYSDPLPLGDPPSLSIPRISWSKYVLRDGRYTVHISYTLNHALIDGYELSQAILRLQEALDRFEEFVSAGKEGSGT